VHAEPPQSFHAWRTGPRRPPTEERRTLRVLAIDDVSRFGVTVDLLLEHLEAYYGLPAIEAKPASVPEFTTRDRGGGRAQTLTREVLRWLEGEVGSDTYCVLAVTSRDLYPDPSWNYVFGEASLVARVGVFSFARMDSAFPESPADPADRTEAERVLLLRRCLGVVTHEVGHMFGIEHCVLRRCLMNGSNHVAEMDRTPLHLCPTCLAKIVHATHVDVLARYGRLEAFYRRNGLVEESKFVASRVAALTR
jgi:archaemetzincin